MAHFSESLCEEVIRTEGGCGLTRNEMVQMARFALRAIKNENPYYTRIAALEAELAAARKDAERLDFIVGVSRPMGLDIDGRHYWTTMYPRNVRGANLREAIDAALGKEKA